MKLAGVPRMDGLVLSILVVALVACASPTRPNRNAAVGTGSSPAESSASSAPRFEVDGPNAEEYGAREGYPIGDRSTWYRIPFLVGSHSHLDQIFEGRLIRRAVRPSPFARAPAEPVFHYSYGTETFTLDNYLARNPITGLLIARGDTILVERYQYARNDRHRFASHSMAKTVTSVLVGIAIAEGHIRAVDDPVAAYVVALAGTEYGRTPLRHVLQMSSGVRFVQQASGQCSPTFSPPAMLVDLCVFGDDVVQLVAHTFGQVGSGGVEAVKPFNERVRPSSTIFSYSSLDTQVLGLVLRSAVGRPVADYLREKIWEPMGAEADATWLIDRSGQEATYCCLNAVLRDYARLGLLLANNGKWRGRQLIPAAWLDEAMQLPEQAHLRFEFFGEHFGYGYQVWIFAGEHRMFVLHGQDGQLIFVDPASRLVMVHTAVRKFDPRGLEREALALWRGVVRDLAADHPISED
jgi:CubicO group peptidase (beta-lactamase class C family)